MTHESGPIRARILVLAATLFLAVPMTTGVDVPEETALDLAAEDVFVPPAQHASYEFATLDGIEADGVRIKHDVKTRTIDGEIFDAPACTWRQADPNGPTRTRSSVRVGINDFGSLGVGTKANGDVLTDTTLAHSDLRVGTSLDGADVATDGTSAAVSTQASAGTAFQMPIGAANENLAVGWWGEGWLIHTPAIGSAYHYPSTGAGGAVTQVDDVYTDSERYVTYRITVDLGEEGELLTDFEWTLDREDCDLTLRTTIENQADYAQDVAYKRVVDWDNLDSANANGPTTGFYNAQWSEDGRTATATRHHTVGTMSVPLYECRTTVLGTELPDTIDLDAWDDYRSTGTGSDYMQGSFSGDGNAAFHFSRAALPPGGTWTTHLRYECDHFVQPVVSWEPVDGLGDIRKP